MDVFFLRIEDGRMFEGAYITTIYNTKSYLLKKTFIMYEPNYILFIGLNKIVISLASLVCYFVLAS